MYSVEWLTLEIANSCNRFARVLNTLIYIFKSACFMLMITVASNNYFRLFEFWLCFISYSQDSFKKTTKQFCCDFSSLRLAISLGLVLMFLSETRTVAALETFFSMILISSSFCWLECFVSRLSQSFRNMAKHFMLI